MILERNCCCELSFLRLAVTSASRPKASANITSANVIRKTKNILSKSVVPNTSPDPTLETIFATAYQHLKYVSGRFSLLISLYINQFKAYYYSVVPTINTQLQTHQCPIVNK